MKRQEKRAIEEADAARFKGKEAKEPKTLTQFQILEQKMQREAQARAMARKEVQRSPADVAGVCAVEPFACCVTLVSGAECQIHGNMGCRGAPCKFSRVPPVSSLPRQANPNHVLRDEMARAAEEGRDFVSARSVDQALQVHCSCHGRSLLLRDATGLTCCVMLWQALSFETSEEAKQPKTKALHALLPLLGNRVTPRLCRHYT